MILNRLGGIVILLLIASACPLAAQSVDNETQIGFITDFPLDDQSRSFINQITAQIDQTTGTSL